MKYMLLIHQGTTPLPGSKELWIVDAVIEQTALEDYRYVHSTRAELLRRLGRTDEAREAYARALALAHDNAERRLLERRLAELQ